MTAESRLWGMPLVRSSYRLDIQLMDLPPDWRRHDAWTQRGPMNVMKNA